MHRRRELNVRESIFQEICWLLHINDLYFQMGEVDGAQSLPNQVVFGRAYNLADLICVTPLQHTYHILMNSVTNHAPPGFSKILAKYPCVVTG